MTVPAEEWDNLGKEDSKQLKMSIESAVPWTTVSQTARLAQMFQEDPVAKAPGKLSG